MAQPWPEWVQTPMALMGTDGREIGVLEDDVGRLAPELQEDLLHRVRRLGHDAPAGDRRAGEGDHVHPGVGGEDLAHQVVGRGDHVDHAGGDVGLLGDEPAQEGGRPRGVGGRLQHDGVPRRQGGAELGQVQVEGEVPGGDGAHHADGLPADEAALGLAEDLADGQPVLVLVLVGLRRPVAEVVDGPVHLHDVGQHQGAADLGHHDVAELLLVGLERGVELLQAAAAQGVVLGPGRLVEGATGRGDGRGPCRPWCRRRCRPGSARWPGRCWRSSFPRLASTSLPSMRRRGSPVTSCGVAAGGARACRCRSCVAALPVPAGGGRFHPFGAQARLHHFAVLLAGQHVDELDGPRPSCSRPAGWPAGPAGPRRHGRAPGRSSTTAWTRWPIRSSGRPKTAASTTSGSSASAVSTSAG